MKTLTDAIIIDAILELLIKYEENGINRALSPSAVCRHLDDQGFKACRGCWYRQKPDPDVFEQVCDLAREHFSYELKGNTRRITL